VTEVRQPDDQTAFDLHQEGRRGQQLERTSRRGPPRVCAWPARGRRQLQVRRTHRARPRAGGRRGGLSQPYPRAQVIKIVHDVDGAAGRGIHLSGRANPPRRHAGRPAGLRDDDHRRQSALSFASRHAALWLPRTSTAAAIDQLETLEAARGAGAPGRRGAPTRDRRAGVRGQDGGPENWSASTRPAVSTSTTSSMDELVDIKGFGSTRTRSCLSWTHTGHDAVRAAEPSTCASASRGSYSPRTTAPPGEARSSPSVPSPASPSSTSGWARRWKALDVYHPDACLPHLARAKCCPSSSGAGDHRTG